MNKQNTSSQIERFLRNLMEAAEKESFLQQIRNDPALAQQIRVYKAEMLVMEELEAIGLRRKMRDWERQRRIRKGILGGIIGLLVCAGLFQTYWFGSFAGRQPKLSPHPVEHPAPKNAPPASADTSYLEKKEAPPKRPVRSDAPAAARIAQLADSPDLGNPTFRGENRQSEPKTADRLQEAVGRAFSADDLASAIRIADSLVALDTLRPARSLLLLGTLQLYDLQFERAANTLEQIKPPFREAAAWNLLLAYRYAGKAYSKRYQALFQQIMTDPEHPAHTKLLRHADALNTGGKSEF
ncbi:MAG: hypothetical protein RL742_848 [Bacteroidota bacterium]|jgi:hypothetical protein